MTEITTSKRTSLGLLFFAKLSGHSTELVTTLHPAEQARIFTLGSTLLLPVLIASMGSLATVYKLSGELLLSVSAALIVGGFTLIVDRAFIGSCSRGVTALLFRVALVIITSTVFSHTALLWVFKGKIAERCETNRMEILDSIASRFRPDFDSNSLFDADLQMVVEGLERSKVQIDQLQLQLKSYQKEYEDEVAGRGPSGLAGEGKESRRILNSKILPLQAELAKLEARQGETATNLEQQRKHLRERERARLAAFETDQRIYRELSQKGLNQSTNGVLMEFLILHQIIKEDRMALWAYLLISLLLFFWEILPIALKYTGRKSPYERQLELLEAEVIARTEAARKNLSERSKARESHLLKMELMELSEIEAVSWLAQSERRFEAVQEKRAAIPKRATPEQRRAYLEALAIAAELLRQTGSHLMKQGKFSNEEELELQE